MNARLQTVSLVLMASFLLPVAGRGDDHGMGGGGYGGGGFDWVPLVEGILRNIPQDDDYYDEPAYEPYYEQPNYQPQAPAIPRNVAPRNVAAAPAIKLAKNPILGLSLTPITQKQIDNLSHATTVLTRDELNNLKDGRGTRELTSLALKSLQEALTDKERADLKQAVDSGKPEDVKKLLEGKDIDPALKSSLESLAQTNQQINALAAQQAASAAQLQALSNQVNQLQQQINTLNQALARQAQINQQLINQVARQNAAINRLIQQVNQLNRNRLLVDLLRLARPGQRRVPAGGGTVIVRMPNMPAGTVTPIGPGAVLQGPRLGTAQSGRLPYSGPSDISTGNVWQAAGIAVAKGEAVADSKLPIDRGIVLINKADVDVSFVVETETFNMKPSFFQAFGDLQQATITFDKGNGQNAQYSITAGTYEFTATDNGWELYRQTYKTTIDNSGNPSPFQFVLGSQTVSLASGEVKEFSSPYAHALRFDNGNGQTHEKRLFTGSFKVGTGAADGTLDLFTAAAIPATQEPSLAAQPSDEETGELFAPFAAAHLDLVADPTAGSDSDAAISITATEETGSLIAPPQP